MRRTLGRDAVRVPQACKAVVTAHRLILSGTPVQNSIGELWGLFDWLMPGFLGSEKVFQVPIPILEHARVPLVSAVCFLNAQLTVRASTSRCRHGCVNRRGTGGQCRRHAPPSAGPARRRPRCCPWMRCTSRCPPGVAHASHVPSVMHGLHMAMHVLTCMAAVSLFIRHMARVDQAAFVADQAVCAAAHKGPGAVRPAAEDHPGRLCGAVAAAGMSLPSHLQLHNSPPCNISCSSQESHQLSDQLSTSLILAVLQMRLLADLSGSAMSAQIAGALVGGGAGDVSTASDTAPHVFQARWMQHLRLCSPELVLLLHSRNRLLSRWSASDGRCRVRPAGAAVHAQGVQPPGAGAGAG